MSKLIRELEECLGWNGNGKEEYNMEQNDMTLSMHAIEGKLGDDTIRTYGEYKNKKLSMLIDSGSTHSFVDTKVANDLKLPLVEISRVVITVADG